MYIKRLINIIVLLQEKVKMLMVNNFYYKILLKFILLDMRKSLPRDKNKVLSKPTDKRIEPEKLEFH